MAALQIPPSATSVARAVIMCAIKTRLITELAFPDSVQPARMLGLVHQYFPETVKVTTVTAETSDGSPDPMQRGSLTILRAIGPQEKTLGVLAFTVWAAHPAQPETWWAVSPGGVVRDVLVVGRVDDTSRDQFAALVGADLPAAAAEAAQAPQSPSACAVEVLAVLAAHQIGAPVDGQE